MERPYNQYQTLPVTAGRVNKWKETSINLSPHCNHFEQNKIVRTQVRTIKSIRYGNFSRSTKKLFKTISNFYSTVVTEHQYSDHLQNQT